MAARAADDVAVRVATTPQTLMVVWHLVLLCPCDHPGNRGCKLENPVSAVCHSSRRDALSRRGLHRTSHSSSALRTVGTVCSCLLLCG